MSLTARAIALWLVVMAVIASRAMAHPPVPTFAEVDVRPDGHVHVIITHDALAYALNDTSVRVTDPQMHALLRSPEAELDATLTDARERFAGSFRVIVDGVNVPFEVSAAPTLERVQRWMRDRPTLRLPCTMDFVVDAELPVGARELSVRVPPVMSDTVVSIQRPGCETVFIPLSAGEVSPAVEVGMVRGGSGEAPGDGARPRGNPVGIWGIAWRYVRLGYTHIIPYGADHGVFVFGLFLLSPRVKDLVWQITWFTIAHSVTLTLATLGLVRISPSIVEPVIALTIMIVALENLWSTEPHAWRAAVAFVFGLVHGLGFASALMEVGLPMGELATGLIAFNVGVECGHMTVVAAAFAVLGWTRHKKWYRNRVALPLSMAIALVAGMWMVQRLMG